MAFFQQPPRLDNPFDGDAMLASWIARFCPEVAAELRTLRERSVEFHAQQLAPRCGGARVAGARGGMVAAGYEPRYGDQARTHQFAIVHVLGPSLDVYTCPLAMTDGAARTLLASGNQALIDT